VKFPRMSLKLFLALLIISSSPELKELSKAFGIK
jgi:hypothetical protein